MGIQLDKSKVNFFEKMIWRIKYRDLYKNFGSNILAMKVLLHLSPADSRDKEECPSD